MKILVIADIRDKQNPLASVGGVDYWRTVIPAINLARQYGHKVDIQREITGECKWDVVITSRVLSLAGKDDVAAQRVADWGISLVVDIDDYWHLPEKHILYENWYQNRMPDRVYFALEHANLIWASTPLLRKKLEHWANKAAIIPNAVDPSQPQFANPENRVKSDKVRLGWAGSVTHTHDFPVTKEGFKRLVTSDLRDKYVMNLYGYKPENQMNFIAFTQYKIMCGLHNTQFWDAKPVDSYANCYRNMDVALAPLSNNEFNSCKSELKLLEAANFGLPVIASNCLPYYQTRFKDAVLFAGDGEGWYNQFRKVITSSKARKHYGQALQKVVREHYDIRKITELRHKSLCELTGLK